MQVFEPNDATIQPEENGDLVIYYFRNVYFGVH